jgi:ankyrin repeat protein
MYYAVKNGHLEVVKYLHEAGKDCTTYAMHWAIRNNHIKVAKYLHSIGKKCTDYIISEELLK